MIDIYVLSSEFKKLDIIDYSESIIWTSRYCRAGDFELYLPANRKSINLLKIGNMIMRSDKRNQLMIISSVKITTDEETGNHIIVSGQSAESILSKRIVWRQTNLSGTLTACVTRLLNENIIKPADKKRQISFIEIGEICDSGIAIKKQITGTNLLEAVRNLLDTYKLGFKLVFTGKLRFDIYNGVNRSANQSDHPRVIFSEEYDNLLTSEYESNASNFKNVALVAGEGEGTKRKTYAIGTSSGLDRVEIYVDARDISSNVDGGTISTDQYNELLKAKGEEALSDAVITESFAGSVDPQVNYTYGIDYNLGDIVQITNEYDISAQARITEVIESWNDDGYSCIPTFDTEEV